MELTWSACFALTCLMSVAYAAGVQDIRVSSYNLWNVMFNWDVRKHRIAEMIRDTQPDVIGFQEVRGYKNGEKNQVAELKLLLPEYRWMRYHPANYVQKVNGSFQSGWEREGLGLLSKWPILKSRVHVLSQENTGDTNKRVSLAAQITINEKVILNAIVVHFSYDRQQQCQNSAEILKHLTDLKLPNAIILGDFNTYSDFEWPVKVITSMDRELKALGPCHQVSTKLVPPETISLDFSDVWKSVAEPGDFSFTFSNMPTPGLHIRPDRVLASSIFKPLSLSLIGNGEVYEKRYRQWITLDRFWTIISQARNSLAGETGYSCLHDCGPHGSCRCGVCVSGTNTNNCHLPNCKECNSATVRTVLIFCAFLLLSATHVLYASIIVLTHSVRRHGRTVRQILGCNCCLCNPTLYSSVSMFQPTFSRKSKLHKYWPILKLPPMFLLLFSVAISMMTFYFGKLFLFSDMLITASSIMDEEFYPSDHLMVIANLRVED